MTSSTHINLSRPYYPPYHTNHTNPARLFFNPSSTSLQHSQPILNTFLSFSAPPILLTAPTRRKDYHFRPALHTPFTPPPPEDPTHTIYYYPTLPNTINFSIKPYPSQKVKFHRSLFAVVPGQAYFNGQPEIYYYYYYYCMPTCSVRFI